jgi:two-component system NarL family sensor kinase
LILFRVIQELVNNILKHSQASFIHLTEHDVEDKVVVRLHHDGKGLTQEEFLRFTKEKDGLRTEEYTKPFKGIIWRYYV